MISISNSLYISQLLGSAGGSSAGKPIIGWQSIITIANITATSSDPDYPILNAWNPDTSQLWKSDSLPTDLIVDIQITNTNGDPVDYLGIAKHNFGSGDVTYRLQESANGSTWSDVFADTTVTTDKAIMHYFDSRTTAYFRLRMTGVTTPPQLAHLKLGLGLVLERPIFVGHRPATISASSRSLSRASDTGQYLGKVVTARWYEATIEQKNTTQGFVRNYLAPFIEHMQCDPDANDGSAQGAFFFAWRPVDYPAEVIFCWTEDDIHPENQDAMGYMSYSFNVQGVV